MDPADTIRLLKRHMRKHPTLLRLLQPPVIRATLAMRRRRIAKWYGSSLNTKEETSAAIHRRIIAGTPSAFGKLGTLELELLAHDAQRAPGGQRVPTTPTLRELAFINVGLFPATDDILWRAFDEIREALHHVDIIAVFGNAGEREIMNHEGRHAMLCETDGLEPWDAAVPWSAALEGKRVLMIHPFVETAKSQYENHRAALWPHQPTVLPEFELQTLRMPLSVGIAPPEEADWHERLDRMRHDMSDREFDVALIGAGGMSLPLAAHAKKMGAIGIHMGGPSQLLFGIRGRRWDEDPGYQHIFTNSWTRPSRVETAPASAKIEGGCYW